MHDSSISNLPIAPVSHVIIDYITPIRNGNAVEITLKLFNFKKDLYIYFFLNPTC